METQLINSSSLLSISTLMIFVLTFCREKINDKVLVAADVEAGLAVNCIITEVRNKDLIVQINNWHHLKAKVPAAHLSDSHVSDISKRFTKGQRIKGRVSYLAFLDNGPNFNVFMIGSLYGFGKELCPRHLETVMGELEKANFDFVRGSLTRRILPRGRCLHPA
jgi:hypothetical protein